MPSHTLLFNEKFVNIYKMMKNRFLPYKTAVFALLFSVVFFSCSNAKAKTASYEFANIRRGTLERTVSSSGAINPVATVKVLPRMSGKVEKVNVDYNDTVHRGDILAELNTDTLRLQRDQMSATVQKARANYELQLITYRNQEALAEKNLISEFELKTSKTTLDNQAADLAIAESNLKVKETEINQYAYITSPIEGIVLDRNVNVGDTVVDSSSNNSTSIFTIAENLREMQIEAAVSELDVTSIHKGQQVRFKLESFPGRSFAGIVENLRMTPISSSNVVSYMVIINVENQDGALLPGMTCIVDFIVESVEDVLIVPNAALRYQPTGLSGEEIADMLFNASLANMSEEDRRQAEEARAAAAKAGEDRQSGITELMMGRSGMVRRSPGQNRQGALPQGRGAPAVMRNLWFMDADEKLSCMQVRAGTSDGSFTHVFLPDEFEDRQIILREKI